MATTAQINANVLNAQSSTGPRTPEGKLASSQNGIESGLFTTRDFILPHETAEFEEFSAGCRAEIAPEGVLENILFSEILSAAWRLRRCQLVEAASPLTEELEKSLHRARASAQNFMRRATAELRRLQTDRQIRTGIFPEGSDFSHLGLASIKETIAATNSWERARLEGVRARQSGLADLLVHQTSPAPAAPTAAPAPAKSASLCKAPEQTPRNSLCPCQSGRKYKRCCGVNAPPVLGKAA